MASNLSVEKLFANAKIEMWDHDPGADTAVIVSPDGGTTKRVVDMRDYGAFACVAMSSTLTGAGITKLEIVAFTDSAGSANTTVVKDSGTVVADAVGDYVALECTAEELAQLSSAGSISPGLRYLAGRVTCANSADEAVVTYVRHMPRFPAAGLTATTIA